LTNDVTLSPFEIATALSDSIYDTASIHAVVERRDTDWSNLYTVVIYGRLSDFFSVPAELEIARYTKQRFACLRQRVAACDARGLLRDAAGGLAKLGKFGIRYDIERAIEGFRPANVFDEALQSSLWQTSMWGRERIGRKKRVGDLAFTKSNFAAIVDELRFLDEVRWSSLPLARRPEKLGDLDEYWPTPIEMHSRAPASGFEVGIERDLIDVADERVHIVGALIRDGLQVGQLSLVGCGPHVVPIEVHASDLRLLVDGVPMDGSCGHYIRYLGINMALSNRTILQIPKAGGRPEFELEVGARLITRTGVGTEIPPSVRHAAWGLGAESRRWTADTNTVELVYDPDSRPNEIQRAFDDLKKLGGTDSVARIVVADPYALDEKALAAVAAIAARAGGSGVIDVMTAFEVHQGNDVPKSDAQAQRERAQAQAIAVAQKIASSLGVRIRIFRISRLHDRFLVIDDRVWHVGHSFNAIGEAISAIVEMRDQRRKAEVRAVLSRFESNPIFDSNP
jgi:hypothetical protein